MNSNKQKALTRISRDKGLNVVIMDDHKQMAYNKQLYRGKIDGFHDYKITDVKGRTHTAERLSTQIGKRIAEDFTSLLFNENSRVYYEDDRQNDVLQDIIEDNNFYERFGKFLETSYGALGNGYAVVYYNDGKPKIDFINGDDGYITSHDNGETYGIVVLNEKSYGSTEYTHLTFHTFSDGEYKVEHQFFENGKNTPKANKDIGSPMTNTEKISQVFRLDKRSLDNIQSGDEFIWSIITDHKYFVHFKPNIKNNHNIKSPYGISIISNARDLIKALDEVYTASVEEYENGKSRIFVNTSLLEKKMIPRSDGSQDMINFFDGDKTEYVAMPLDSEDEPIKIYNPTLREEQYNSAINRILASIGFQVGFGKSYYQMKDGLVASTATEVKMNKSDLWRNIRKHQNLLGEQLTDLVAALLDASDLEVERDKIRVEFDDSIIIDDEAEYEKAMREYDKGMMTKKEFIMQFRGKTEEEAEEIINGVEQEQSQEQNALFGIGAEDEDELSE